MTEHCWQMMMRAKESRGVKESWMSPLILSLEEADERTELFHYTNVESLLKILSGRYFRFSRLDILNDPLEKKPLETIDLYKRVFVASFTHEIDESLPMWKMYTQRGLGIRLDLFFKTDSINTHFIDDTRDFVDMNNVDLDRGNEKSNNYVGYSFLKIKDIDYNDHAYEDQEVIRPAEDGYDILVDNLGWFKSKIWEYEKETRLVLSFHNGIKKMDTEYLLVPIDTTQLRGIVIRFDPWMSEEMKYCIQKGIEKYKDMWGINVECISSELLGKVF